MLEKWVRSLLLIYIMKCFIFNIILILSILVSKEPFLLLELICMQCNIGEKTNHTDIFVLIVEYLASIPFVSRKS